MAAALCASIAWAEAPAGYYSTLEGKCGVALKKAAKEKVRDHKAVSYGGGISGGTWSAFRQTDVKIVNGKEYWWDMYSNNLVPVNTIGGLNIEHGVANSWWGGSKNDAYKDLFHLNPSDATANNRKANYPLGEIAGSPTWTNGVTNVGHPVSGQGGGNSYVYEPHDDYKGDFARAFMYMFTVYDDIAWKDNTAWMYNTANALMFNQWAVELLLRWSKEDPVDEKERKRNETIYTIQGNRNPFIDMPELAEHIWGSKNTQPFHADGSGNEPTPGPDPQPVPDETVLIDQNFESTDIPFGWGNEVVSGTIDWYMKSFSGNRYATVSAYKGTADGGPYESWLISPEIVIPEDCEAFMSFRTQGAYGAEGSVMNVYALDSANPATATANELTEARICVPNPDGMSPVYCDWVESGETSLGKGARTLYVGFRYYSPKGGSGNSSTYCVDNFKVVVRKNGSSAVEEITLFPEVYTEGRNIICPEGSMVFDLNGRACGRTDLQPGLYIVAVESGKAVKVLVK